MESILFKKLLNESGRISGLEIGGLLVIENSQQLKKELLDVGENLCDQIKITITEVEEIDLSCIQLVVAFIEKMIEIKVSIQFDWNITDDQRSFLENIGFSSVLFMNNSYV